MHIETPVPSCLVRAPHLSLQGETNLVVPAGAFTWLNRHHDTPSAQSAPGKYAQGARQQPGRAGHAAPVDESPHPSGQAESDVQPWQPRPKQTRGDGRAFKSTDVGWRADSNYWKNPKPATNPSSSPASPSRQSARTSFNAPGALGAQAPGSSRQQSAQQEPAKASQAPRLR